jgi:hypothetical protein
MKKRRDKLSEHSEIQEMQNACVALSLPNKKHAYEVAAALKFAEDRAVTAAGIYLAGGRDEGRSKPKGD